MDGPENVHGTCSVGEAEGGIMSVAKIIEVVAASPNGWEDAVRKGVEEASRTVRGIRGVDVQDWTARVENNRIVEYKANLKIAFAVEE
jgi:flavin-binding protein dodecin